MKRIWKDYFTFSKKERIAVMLLLFLMVTFLTIPHFYSANHRPPILNKALQDYIANSPKTYLLMPKNEARSNKTVVGNSDDISKPHISLFPFNPNTLSVEGWRKLGISEKTIKTLINYRNKGGKFKIKEDIRKIWGLRKEEADRIISFVELPDTPLQKTQSAKYLPNTFTGNSVEGNGGADTQILDINKATAQDWKTLPGIGDVLANRIVKYRERLGGFTHEMQVRKTYGIHDSVFQKIIPFLKLDPANIPKMNLNTISAYDLKVKSNIPDIVAKAIIFYRQEKGPFQSVQDLRKVVFITDSLFQILVLFLKVE